MAFTLYKNGTPVIIDHEVDVKAAMATGLYSMEPPKPAEEKPSAKKRGRPPVKKVESKAKDEKEKVETPASEPEADKKESDTSEKTSEIKQRFGFQDKS